MHNSPLFFSMLRKLERLQTPHGKKLGRRFLVLSALVGVLDGTAVLSLLPLTAALVEGRPIASWLWGLFTISVCSFALRFAAAMCGYASALDFLRTGHRLIGEKLATLPLGWFRPENTSSIGRLVTERFMMAAESVAYMTGLIVREGFALIALMVGVFFFNAKLGVSFLVIVPVTIVVLQLAIRVRQHGSNRALPANARLSQRIVEFAQAQPALRAAGRSEGFEPLEEAIDADHKARVRELWESTAALLLTGMSVQLFVVLLMTGIARLAIDGSLRMLETIALIGIILRFTRSLEQLSSTFVGLDTGRVAVEETEKIVKASSLPEPAAPQNGDDSGRVMFDEVSFGYGDSLVLDRISFCAEPGTVTAIVGPSGSGKTTIARLISRFWDVDSGRVVIDGVDIRELGTTQLMSRLSMVFQEVYLFDDTLLANIKIGRPEATEEDIYYAAELAGVTSIAERLGWQSSVGEGGKLLSGGERQRVSVARALLKQAPIVLFDEATSALDAENEGNILAAVEELRKNSTFIVIAHKLDTVRSADQILVLDKNGCIAQRGTHTELLEEGGLYERFWQHREAATGWRLAES